MCFKKYDDTELKAALLDLASEMVALRNDLGGVAQDLQEQIVDLNKAVFGEPQEPIDVWDRKAPMEDWPKEMGGIPVGYVQLGEPKSPLYYHHVTTREREMRIYENANLREGDTTDAKRIIAKAPYWFMVRADGDDYHYGEPRPFSQMLDGDDVWYMVMHEQIIDGINLSSVSGLPEVYINLAHVVERYMPQ